jgi:nucleotide-binding universal stress UspA family protein
VAKEAVVFKIRKMLYPTDFSDASFVALKHAIGLAKAMQAKLIVMHVVNQKMYSEGLSLARMSAPESLGKELADEARRKLKMIIPAEERPGLEWETMIRAGNPAQEIIGYAKDNDIDMIVIGTAGRSGMEHFMFGSTAEKVVRGAHCPVLSVKPAAMSR